MSPERSQGETKIDQIADLAKEVLLKLGSHVPTVIVVGSLGKGVAELHGELETSEDRAKAMKVLGRIFRKENTLGRLEKVYFVSEGWMSKAARSDKLIQPSKDPNRVEVLVVSGLDLVSKKTELLLFEMVREMSGRLHDIRPYEIEETKKGLETRSYLLEAFFRGYIGESSHGNGNYLR